MSQISAEREFFYGWQIEEVFTHPSFPHFSAPRECQLLWVGVTDYPENLGVGLVPRKHWMGSWSSQLVKRTGNEPSKRGKSLTESVQ